MIHIYWLSTKLSNIVYIKKIEAVKIFIKSRQKKGSLGWKMEVIEARNGDLKTVLLIFALGNPCQGFEP
ncbi:hypothetical protein DRF60_11775 [Chryseobacterium elymi]|uniref:Uncharacterized protein n=1 Tax=Chryseobacterium elymi TaxID=395936 RepID=A0A3D9DGJ5_9FLAO|nr:hypothetical protein DRF60_11775 [Chryseobacterium elymi]